MPRLKRAAWRSNSASVAGETRRIKSKYSVLWKRAISSDDARWGSITVICRYSPYVSKRWCVNRSRCGCVLVVVVVWGVGR